MSKKIEPPKEFTSIEAAFDYCRDCNKPVRVFINGVPCKLFPSGRMVRPVLTPEEYAVFKGKKAAPTIPA